ncbi:MAG: hypothetical protein WBH75_11830 [Thermoanaerobaculia bacterium]
MKPDFLELFRALDRAGVDHVSTLLDQIEARYRDPAGRDIRPTLDRLKSNKMNLLETNLGPLDAMQRIGAGWFWAEVVERSHVVQVGDLEVRVLDLASIIESKVAANRDKDRAMLPLLRRTLESKGGEQ